MSQSRQHHETRWLLCELALLLAAFTAIGVVMVPCHWTSTWADREFTGWVVPIANRVAAGQLLYTDGGHLPLPPLSFVLAALLFGAHGTWLSESVLNFTFQCLAILILYVGLSRHVRQPVPFLAALATMPMFFSLPKTIAYDAITQALVSLVAVTAAAYVLPGREGVRSTHDLPLRRAGRLSALAVATAACILSKQSTAAGAALGVCSAIALLPPSDSWRQRLGRLMAYIGAVTAALLLGCVLLTPFMSVQGFFLDVFLTGSEPKGGLATLSGNLGDYAFQIAALWTPTMLAAAVLLLIFGMSARRRSSDRAAADANESELGGSTTDSPGPWLLVYLAAIVGAVTGLAMLLSLHQPVQPLPGFSPIVGMLPADLLSIGLLLCLILIALAGLAALAPRRALAADLQPLMLFALVLFPAAVFHTLSVAIFRWTYDNNPLIMGALAVVVFLACRTVRRLLPSGRITFMLLATAAAFAFELVMWTTLGSAAIRIRSCTDTWPEVRYLAGARLAPSAAGMRDVVKLVRRLAPQPTDTVLLLPSDPNVESWFERSRPALSGAIVFVDQYWDRYVDADFDCLMQDRPKVIVMGPRHFGRSLQLFWHGNTGAARLIQRVDNELLPRYYRLFAQQKIKLVVNDDFMDVYVRVDKAH